MADSRRELQAGMYDAVQMSVSSRLPSNRSSISDLPHMAQVHQRAPTGMAVHSCRELARHRVVSLPVIVS